MFQGAVGPDGPTGESGLEGKKVSPMPSFNPFFFFRNCFLMLMMEITGNELL